MWVHHPWYLSAHPHLLTFLVFIDDFFVGIGDINSAFLPKITPLAPSVPSQPPASSANPTTTTPPSSSLTRSLPNPLSDIRGCHTRVTTNAGGVGSLAKKQEELEEQDQKEEVQNQSGDASEPGGKGSEAAEAATDLTTQQVSHRHPANASPRNDDHESLRVQSVRCF